MPIDKRESPGEDTVAFLQGTGIAKTLWLRFSTGISCTDFGKHEIRIERIGTVGLLVS
jgi:hypothetical protein